MNDITSTLKVVKTSKWIRSTEAFFEIFLKLFGVYVTFLLFNLSGEVVMGEDFSADTLFSLLLLPALYILKEGHVIILPFFVKVRVSKTSAESRTGIITQRLDKLNLKNVENIEVISPLLGRVFNYGTLYFYTYGSWVCLPFVMGAHELKDKLEAVTNNLEKGD